MFNWGYLLTIVTSFFISLVQLADYCVVCLEQGNLGSFTTLNKIHDDHKWCISCIGNVIKACKHDRSLFPPSCCSHEISRSLLESCCKEDMNWMYERALERKSNPLAIQDILIDFNTLMLFLDFSITSCPSCSTLHWRDGGCDHIKCYNCKYDFCFSCGEKSENNVCRTKFMSIHGGECHNRFIKTFLIDDQGLIGNEIFLREWLFRRSRLFFPAVDDRSRFEVVVKLMKNVLTQKMRLIWNKHVLINLSLANSNALGLQILQSITTLSTCFINLTILLILSWPYLLQSFQTSAAIYYLATVLILFINVWAFSKSLLVICLVLLYPSNFEKNSDLHFTSIVPKDIIANQSEIFTNVTGLDMIIDETNSAAIKFDLFNISQLNIRSYLWDNIVSFDYWFQIFAIAFGNFMVQELLNSYLLEDINKMKER